MRVTLTILYICSLLATAFSLVDLNDVDVDEVTYKKLPNKWKLYYRVFSLISNKAFTFFSYGVLLVVTSLLQ